MNMMLVRKCLCQLYPDCEDYELGEQLRASFEDMRLQMLEFRSIRRKRHIRHTRTLMIIFFLAALTGFCFAFEINIW